MEMAGLDYVWVWLRSARRATGSTLPDESVQPGAEGRDIPVVSNAVGGGRGAMAETLETRLYVVYAIVCL